jgi:hypothetical protein
MNGKASHLTSEFIREALSNRTWDFGNEVLYDLCAKNPDHTRDDVIIAKIWIIGRSYAAAIERRPRVTDGPVGDAFYETCVAPRIRKSQIDDWFHSLRNIPIDDMATNLEMHKRLMGLFYDISKLDKRSLASKYLHFHFRDRFYIYDSRSSTSISQLTSRVEDLSALRDRDDTYARFFLRCRSLNREIASSLALNLTPRELDKVLLKQALSSQRKTKEGVRIDVPERV